ncbi:imidazole glycerol phosphate synthase subunit HisH, partial [bacterium]|nr:imidazole glycerol phosphate synthase subunit HisH [bacterium]
MIIIDYGAGNLKNLKNAFDYMNVPVEISSDPATIAAADKLILPGVGAFGYAMQHLHQRKLVQPLLDRVNAGVPLLGICLGMQLLFSTSEESPGVAGLNLVPGAVKRFQIGFKVPHMGWNELVPQSGSVLT